MGQLQERYKSYRLPQKYMEAGVYPYFREITSKQGTEVAMGGHEVLMFGSNAYTGLTGDPVMTGEEIDVELLPKGIKMLINPFADRSARKPNALQNAAADLFNQLNVMREDLNNQGRHIQAISKAIQKKLNL